MTTERRSGFLVSGEKRRALRLPLNARKAVSFLLTFFICFVTWIILSGRFDFFHLGLGITACTITASLSASMLISVRELDRLPGRWGRFILYVPWLLYQVLLANLHVMYLVCHPRMHELIDPRIIRFQSSLKKPMSRLIFANSITLTPGTITVYVSLSGEFTVHAIDEASGAALPGKMEERIAWVMGE